MTLVTIMGDLDFFLLKVERHGNHLDLVCGTSLDDLVMTAKAQCFNIIPSLHRKLPYNLAILNMISIGSMTHFTGNILMDTSFVDHANGTMTFETRIIGFISDGDIPLILNITSTVMSILAHCFREEQPPGKYPQTTGNNQYHRQLEHMCKVT